MESTDNGLLAAVPGGFIGQAKLTLPEPATAPQDCMSVVVEAEWAGTVRIHIRRYRYSHRRNHFWSWSAYRADRELKGQFRTVEDA